MKHNLEAEISRKGIKKKDIAAELQIDEKTLRNKIKGRTDFVWSEAVQIRDTFFPDIDINYLFHDE